MHIPAPKIKLPETAESYNPPEGELLSEEQKAEWESLDPEDRPRNFVPEKFSNLRSVPAYPRFTQERFSRCLDLYLCPRAIKERITNKEALLPDLPDPKDLEPFPKNKATSYLGHQGFVRCISIDPTGQWLLSGSEDKTVRLWEMVSGRQVQSWSFEEPVVSVSWNPNPSISLFAVAVYVLLCICMMITLVW
jgi:ribosome biogenesis protein ERB1